MFCRYCYILDCDSNLVFRADVVISSVEDFTGSNTGYFSINDNAIDGFVNEAAELIKSSEERLQACLYEATMDLLSKQQEVDRFL